MKKLCSMLILPLIAASAFAAPPGPPQEGRKLPPPPPAERRRPPHGFRKAHGIWMAFAELTGEERQAMLKLQREDPEKFKAEMSRRTEEFFKAEKTRREELKKLVNEYRNAKDNVKEELKNKISALVRSNFKRRLRRSRLQLEELQKRAETLEQELDKREKAEDKIVAAVVENMINGKFPEHPGFPHHRGPRAPRK